MNKTEFIAEVAKNSGITKALAERVLAAVETTVAQALKTDDKIQLTGFGTFEVKERAARTVRNPANGTLMNVQASRAVAFKPGKRLKDAVSDTADE